MIWKQEIWELHELHVLHDGTAATESDGSGFAKPEHYARAIAQRHVWESEGMVSVSDAMVLRCDADCRKDEHKRAATDL